MKVCGQTNVLNPGPLTFESGALQTAPHGLAGKKDHKNFVEGAVSPV